jgi:nucleoside-diphosphate-sugar epimerase
MKKVLYTKSNQFLIDATLTAVAWGLAYLIRFDGLMPHNAAKQFFVLLVPIALGQATLNTSLGIYKFQWRYVHIWDATYIGRSYAAYWLLLIVGNVIGKQLHPSSHVPVSILSTAGVLAFVGAVSARVARRILYERAERVPAQHSRPQKFLILGAGMHGALVAREMLLRRGIDLIGFLDDEPGKQKAVIAGMKVLGPISELPRIVLEKDVDEVLVCIPPQKRSSIHIEVAKTRKGSPIRSRVVPTLEEILQSDAVMSVLPALDEPAGNDGNPEVIVRHKEGADEKNDTNGFALAVHGNGNGSSHGNRKLASWHISTGESNNLARLEAAASLPRNKSILITGGAGFIGSSLAEKLVAANRVILFDQCFEHSPIQYTSLPGHPNATAIKGSILETDLRALVRDVDIVIHAAAILGVNRVCHAGRETLETNYVGTSRLLKAFEPTQHLERFIYFSTSEVFGVNSYRVDEASRPSIGPIAESRWSYAMSKLAGEHLVASYSRETGLPTTIVRPFNIFGPRRTGDYALRRFILSALHGEPLQIHGDGTQIRSWCYIDDFCSALVQMIMQPKAVGEDFNIGNPGNTLTISELAEKVIHLTGSRSEMVFRDSPFPDISIRVPSLDKAKRLLGYAPRYDLKTGLTLTIQWHRENLEFLPQAAITSEVTADAVAEQDRAA